MDPVSTQRKRLDRKQCAMLGMVAHACNLNLLGGRDWEDYGLRLAQAKS
jgi:hypothetical protein